MRVRPLALTLVVGFGLLCCGKGKGAPAGPKMRFLMRDADAYTFVEKLAEAEKKKVDVADDVKVRAKCSKMSIIYIDPVPLAQIEAAAGKALADAGLVLEVTETAIRLSVAPGWPKDCPTP